MEAKDATQLEQSLSKKALTTFPFSKTTCVCNCGKYKLNELPRLRNILPDNYEYKLCEYLQLDREDKFLVTLRMTLSTKEEALEWMRSFEERSLTTHVKDKTYPNVERVSVFKAQYRCQFFDRRKSKKKSPEKSKFRDCHSILFINIKKYFRKTVDHHMPKYKMVVRIHYAHDHPLDTADVLKKRQLNEDIKQRFLEMFRQGMKPKDALDLHKKELLHRLGPEKYRQVVCDGYFVPNVPKIYRLYYQIHGKGVSAKTTTKRSSRHNPNPDWIAFQNCQDAVNDEEEDCTEGEYACRDKDSVDLSREACLTTQGMVTDSHCSMGDHVTLQAELLEQGMNADEVLGAKVLPEDVCQTHHSLTQDSELEKLAESAIAYPNIAAHNSVFNDLRNLSVPGAFSDPRGQSLSVPATFNDLRGQSLSVPAAFNDLRGQSVTVPATFNDLRGQSLSVPASLFSEAHLGTGIFNATQQQQPSWDNFSVIQHAAVMASNLVAAHHNLDFQSSVPQSSDNAYMAISQPSCEDHNFLVPEGILDPRLQNSVNSQDNGEYDMLMSQQYAWSQTDRPIQSSGTETDKVMANRGATSNHTARKSATRKYIQKRKKKVVKELNMKHVTKKWMERKPKVEAETQNMASEVVQSILLTDEAEKLNVKLDSFFNKLKGKMTSDPKQFVPAIRSFMHTAEYTLDDNELLSFLRDFRKTEDNILKSLLQHKQETTKSNSTQTSLSGPVIKLSSIKNESNKKTKVSAGSVSLTRKRIRSKLQSPPKQVVGKLSICKKITNSLQAANGKMNPLYQDKTCIHSEDRVGRSKLKHFKAGADPVHREYAIQASKLSSNLHISASGMFS